MLRPIEKVEYTPYKKGSDEDHSQNLCISRREHIHRLIAIKELPTALVADELGIEVNALKQFIKDEGFLKYAPDEGPEVAEGSNAPAHTGRLGNVRWDDEMLDELNRHAQRMTLPELAEHFDTTEQSIRYGMKKCGLKPADLGGYSEPDEPKRASRWNDETLAELRELAKTMTQAELMKYYELGSANAIKYALRKIDLELSDLPAVVEDESPFVEEIEPVAEEPPVIDVPEVQPEPEEAPVIEEVKERVMAPIIDEPEIVAEPEPAATDEVVARFDGYVVITEQQLLKFQKLRRCNRHIRDLLQYWTRTEEI